MADRPHASPKGSLSERLAEIADLPSIGIALTLDRRTAIAEAVELARRFEAAPVETVPKPPPDIACSGIMFWVPICVAGKRVALVEVPE